MGSKKLAFIGAGNMGTALLNGVLNNELASPDQVCASDVDADKLSPLAKQWGIQTFEDNLKAVDFADTVVLAVKPQVLRSVLSAIKPRLRTAQLLVSVVAGIRSEIIQDLIGKKLPIVRVMPNTPALIGAGASGVCAGAFAREEHMDFVRSMLGSIGTVVSVSEELIDAVTGVSGSGPAYVFMFIEALIDGGVQMGLPRDAARELAVQTVLGAAKLVQASGKHPGQLKDQVTTPAGTTIQALYELEKAGLRPAVMSAVRAAAERSAELSKKARE